MVLCAGRWKGALVAIKVVEHDMTGSSLVVEGARESLLAASIAHPNIVSPPPYPAPTPRSAFTGARARNALVLFVMADAPNFKCSEALTTPARETRSASVNKVCRFLARCPAALNIALHKITTSTA